MCQSRSELVKMLRGRLKFVKLCFRIWIKEKLCFRIGINENRDRSLILKQALRDTLFNNTGQQCFSNSDVHTRFL